MKRSIPFIFPFMGVFACAYAEHYAYPFTSTHDAERFNMLTQEIRCVVCQNQVLPIQAPLAHDLGKNLSHDQCATIRCGIKDYLVQRYGEFILLSARKSAHFLLWSFPFCTYFYSDVCLRFARRKASFLTPVFQFLFKMDGISSSNSISNKPTSTIYSHRRASS